VGGLERRMDELPAIEMDVTAAETRAEARASGEV
jgi:hypothetical protein